MRRPTRTTTGGTTQAPPWLRLAWVGAASAFFGLNGCNWSRGAQTGDPLLGDKNQPPPGVTVQANAGQPNAGPVSVARADAGAPGPRVPAIPTNTSASSLASVAAVLPLQGERAPLGIPDPEAVTRTVATAGPAGAQANDPGWSGQPNAAVSGPVQLRKPVPVATPDVQGLPVPSPPPPGPKLVARGDVLPAGEPEPRPGAASPVADVAALEAELKRRGITRFNHSNTPQGVRFVAVVPDPARSGAYQVYEATEADYPTAVRAVLDRLDRNPR